MEIELEHLSLRGEVQTYFLKPFLFISEAFKSSNQQKFWRAVTVGTGCGQIRLRWVEVARSGDNCKWSLIPPLTYIFFLSCHWHFWSVWARLSCIKKRILLPVVFFFFFLQVLFSDRLVSSPGSASNSSDNADTTKVMGAHRRGEIWQNPLAAAFICVSLMWLLWSRDLSR